MVAVVGLLLVRQVVTFEKQLVPFTAAPIVTQQIVSRGVKFILVQGGRPGSRYINGRQPVGAFIKQAGAQAGINGAFFLMAAIRSKDSTMIGPIIAEQPTGFIPCKAKVNGEKLEGRPFVVWDNATIAFIPYEGRMNAEEGLAMEFPGAQGGFVAGAWLVERGRALTGPEIRAHGPRDAEQTRRRAMFGVTADGKVTLMASTGSVSSSRLAAAAVEAGCQDAVLLDSGFSTSLVYGDRTLVSGHSTSRTPSRPVPHAIVLYDTPAPSAP